MLRIDEISVGRATGRMSPTGVASNSPCPKRKPGKPGSAGTGKTTAGASSGNNGSHVPHISKMLAGQFNPIAFMHRDSAKHDERVESHFTGKFLTSP